MQLPPLMKDLNEGMQLIGWPPTAQRAFFSKLLPAHAESLKGAPLSELEHNLKVKQLEAIFAMPVPGADAVSPLEPIVGDEPAALERRFTAEEAERVGLVEESTVDWDGKVDLDLSAPWQDHAGEPKGTAPATPGDADATGSGPGLLASPGEAAGDRAPEHAATEPPQALSEPLSIDGIKLGLGYQMLLKDEWQKVRLAHVSPAAAFSSSRGCQASGDDLDDLADAGAHVRGRRMRRVETAYLMERATHRARQQLAELNVPTRH
jgi:hypothetical protein